MIHLLNISGILPSKIVDTEWLDSTEIMGAVDWTLTAQIQHLLHLFISNFSPKYFFDYKSFVENLDFALLIYLIKIN